MPRLFVTVALVAGRKPGGVGLIQTLDPAPVKERSRIKKDHDSTAGRENNCKIDIVPGLPGWPRVRKRAERVTDEQDRHRDQRAAEMDDISLLRQDHTSQSHAGTPKVIRRSKFPQTEQPKNEQHREENEPDFVNRIAPVKNETGRDRHRERGHSAYASSDERLEFQREPDADDAYEDNGQTQRPDVPSEQCLRDQQHVKMQRSVIIRRVVFIKAGLHHLIDKPAVDALVEMRWLDSEQEKAQERG